MKKLLTALLLILTIFVTGCSGNESISVTYGGSLSAGLISSPESSMDSESQNTEQFSSTAPAAFTPESYAEVSISVSEQSSEETNSTAEITQSTDNKPVQSEYVAQSISTVSSQSTISSSSSVLPAQNVPESTPTESIAQSEPTEEDNMKTLVVFFSCTSTTKTLAEYAADILAADIYEIVPAEPYTESDLAYYTNGRADREQNDPSVRPKISGGIDNMSDYDTIILGYPIWHGQAPRIISTFLESYDFSGKTIIPFCTSHSSGIGSSSDNLHSLCSADWEKGKRFDSETSRDDIKEWLQQFMATPRKDRAARFVAHKLESFPSFLPKTP